MKIEELKIGDTVWVLDRARVRSGAGPFQAVVAEINNGLFRTAGTRGWYAPREAHPSESVAKLAWFERAEAELKNETARYNKIAARLTAWQSPVTFGTVAANSQQAPAAGSQK